MLHIFIMQVLETQVQDNMWARTGQAVLLESA